MANNFENNNLNQTPGVAGQTRAQHAANPNFKDTTKNDGADNVKGELTYDDKVIQKIVGKAVEQIDGLLTVDGGFFSNIAEKLVNTDNVTAGIETEVGKKQVAVDMDVVIEYGRDIPAIYNQIKKVITDEVAHISEYEDDSETVQDKVTSAAKTTGQFASKQTDKAKNAVSRGTNKAQAKIEENREPRVQ